MVLWIQKLTGHMFTPIQKSLWKILMPYLILKSSNMHNKFFIFDDDKVFTGTMNLSTTGTGGYNANTAVLIKNVTVANAYRSEFEQMFNGKFQEIRSIPGVKSVNLGADGELDIYFSPAGNPLMNGVLPLIKNAKKEIYVSIFYLTHREIIEALILAKSRGWMFA